MALVALDNWLLRTKTHAGLSGFRRFLVEFGYFGLKEARAFTIVANLKHVKERIHVPD